MDATKLNEKLADFPYVNGWHPTKADVDQLKQLEKSAPDYNKLVHLKRWSKHMASFSENERRAFPGGKEEEDDDDIDLFGSDDDEEAEKAKAERAAKMEAEKKGAKPGVIAKSSIVLDVKVWEDTTDLKQVEAEVREIQMDGLHWGAAKQVPVAYGMSKLQIVCVVEDAKVSVDTLTEQIEEMELVQSTDIAAFQKI